MLRASLYRRVIAIAMGASIIVALGVGFFGTAYYRQILDAERDRAFVDLQERLDFMSRMISVTEARMLERGRKALLELGPRAKEISPGPAEGGAPHPFDLGGEDLAETARRLGVEGLYVIDGKGVIVASSVPSDLGLGLTPSPGPFTDFLASVRGSGSIKDQRLSTAERSGRLNTYQYYGPPDTDYIVEVSCELERSFPETAGGMAYRDFVALCFAPYFGSGQTGPITSFDVVNLGAPQGWSVVRPGEKHDLAPDIRAELRESRKATRREGSSIRYYREMERKTGLKGFLDLTVAEIVVDYSSLARFSLLTAFFGLASCSLAGLVSLGAARSFFDRSVLKRIEALRAAMARAPSGDEGFSALNEGDDELAIIGHGIEAMLAEVRAAEEKVRNAKAVEAVGIMAGGLAHDINNLLAGTVGAASLLRSRIEEGGTVEPGELRSTLALIEKTGERGTALVRDLLALARSDRPAPSRLDLGKLVADNVELVRASTPPEVRLEYSGPGQEAWVLGSAEDLGRVMLNLCRNAVQAMTDMRSPEERRGGLLSISLMEGGDGEATWELEVRDTGVGIPDEVLPRLFTPFFSTKSRRRGSGLGLAASKAIVEACGGRIAVESEEGSGSSFTVILPRAATT